VSHNYLYYFLSERTSHRGMNHAPKTAKKCEDNVEPEVFC
jgi:hypothetical protein